MSKITQQQFMAEQARQKKRFNWITEMANSFDKETIAKYYRFHSPDKEELKRMEEIGAFEKNAYDWFRGNVFVAMEAGVYDENTFSKSKFIQVQEQIEIPRAKELRLKTIEWVEGKLIRSNPALYDSLVNEYGADFNMAVYGGGDGHITQIYLPTNVGTLLLIYDPSNDMFTVA